MTLPSRALAGRAVSAIGLGCMNLSHAYGQPPTAEQGRALLHAALDAGVTLFDTAALYGSAISGPRYNPQSSREVDTEELSA